jgi:hypothetical protein
MQEGMLTVTWPRNPPTDNSEQQPLALFAAPGTEFALPDSVARFEHRETAMNN